MLRRDFIERISYASAYMSLSAGTMAWLQSCSSPSDKPTEKSIYNLSSVQERIVADITECIIPETQTVGAKQAKVPAFVIMAFNEILSDEHKKIVIDGLDYLSKSCMSTYNKPFIKCSLAEQTALLINIENTFKANDKANNKRDKTFISILKEFTLVGYFSSKQGIMQNLSYVHIPGRYDGCIDMEEGQKAWG